MSDRCRNGDHESFESDTALLKKLAPIIDSLTVTDWIETSDSLLKLSQSKLKIQNSTSVHQKSPEIVLNAK